MSLSDEHRQRAVAKAESLGYTIVYYSSTTEMFIKKPGDAVNASGHPNVYARVFKGQGHAWGVEEKFDPLSTVI